MKREILLSLGILFCTNCFSQNITITDSQIREKDDKVSVNFIVVTDKIKSDERLKLTPILFNGDKKTNLTSVILSGRNRSITDKRKSLSPGVRANKSQGMPYHVTVPYESWMSDVSLMIECQVENCCTERTLKPLMVVANKPIRHDVVLPPITPIKVELSPIEKLDVEIPFLTPMKEYTAFQETYSDVMRAEGALLVKFRQGKAVIDPSYEDNTASLEQVIKVLELIHADPNASVGKIVLAGTSSPEGSEKINKRLAQSRVKVLADYLRNQTNTDLDLVERVAVSEDWVGLRQMVEKSDMQYKQEVLAIIKKVPVMQGREKQLMDLKWGRPYNYMLQHFFPKLRNAGYIRVFYESTPDKALIKTNEAIELYTSKEYQDALIRLEGVPSSATTEHIRGVCHMMLGEYEKAKTTLNSAVQMGNAQAAESLRQLAKLEVVQQNKQ